MMKDKPRASLTSYDDIFSTEESRSEAQREKVQEIPLSELHPFPNHPFKDVHDERMQDTQPYEVHVTFMLQAQLALLHSPTCTAIHPDAEYRRDSPPFITGSRESIIVPQ